MPHDRLCRYCWAELDADQQEPWCSDRCRRRDQVWESPPVEQVDTELLERAGQQRLLEE